MSTIEPGTPVRVIIDGEVIHVAASTRSAPMVEVKVNGLRSWFGTDEPGVQVMAVDPERPTLDLETIAKAIADANNVTFVGSRQLRTAEAVVALIKTTHPGLIR